MNNVTTQQLGARYAELFTRPELEQRLASSRSAYASQLAHLVKLGHGNKPGDLGHATLAAEQFHIDSYLVALTLKA